MNIFTGNNKRIFTGVFLGLFLTLTLISIIPDMSFAEGTLKVGETSGNGLWTRMKEFVSPYNNGQNTYVPNTYGGSIGVGSYSGGAPKNFRDLIMNTIIGGMLRPIITLIVSAAIVVFLFGVFKFIRSDGKEKETGKGFMVWGLVGLFVMVSVWGLVNILRGTFNLNDSSVNINKAILK